MLTIELSMESGGPVYRQIAEQIKTQISGGSLKVSARLPTVRQLAQELGVSPLTIHKAYVELGLEGLVTSTVGRGTFVIGLPTGTGLANSLGRRKTPEGVLSDWQQVGAAAGLRCFALADPDPRLFSSAEFWNACWRLRKEGPNIFSYGSAAGDLQLRTELAKILRGRAVRANPDDLVITYGAMHALSLITQILARRGDCVAVDQVTYVAMLSLLASQGVEAIPVPSDGDGIDIAELEKVIETRRPKFIYTMPTFHNPTGLLMPKTRRLELLELAARTATPIVEDDAYGLLSFEGPAPLSLRALDTRGIVIYVETFSKSLLPGLRIGYVAAPSAFREKLVNLVMSTAVCGSPFIQRALAHFISEGELKAHLRRVLPRYRERRDVTMKSLQALMPKGVAWTVPSGGLSTWLTLPKGISSDEIYLAALSRGVAFTPGVPFSADGIDRGNLRLSFGYLKPEAISEGVTILADLVKAQLVLRRAV